MFNFWRNYVKYSLFEFFKAYEKAPKSKIPVTNSQKIRVNLGPLGGLMIQVQRVGKMAEIIFLIENTRSNRW